VNQASLSTVFRPFSTLYVITRSASVRLSRGCLSDWAGCGEPAASALRPQLPLEQQRQQAAAAAPATYPATTLSSLAAHPLTIWFAGANQAKRNGRFRFSFILSCSVYL
jgi:hypothetical protein